MSITDPNWVTNATRTIEQDPEFTLEAKQAVFSFLLESSEQRYVIDVDKGHISVTAEPTPAHAWDFAVRGTSESWQRYIDKDPDPEYRDALGMAFQGAMSVTGDIQNRLVMEGNYRKLFANLQPLYVLLSKLQKN